MVNDANADPDIALVMVPLEVIGMFLEFATASNFTIGPVGVAPTAVLVAATIKLMATKLIFKALNSLPPQSESLQST